MTRKFSSEIQSWKGAAYPIQEENWISYKLMSFLGLIRKL